MKKTLDRFSAQAAAYRQHRPTYPPTLYEAILAHVTNRETCWDCATGNGQAAAVLTHYFKQVIATDISERQLQLAAVRPNVEYRVMRAEKTDFQDNTFDLITVAQALHWFDLNAFFREVKRVAKPGAILAVWGYGLVRFNPDIDGLLDQFYREKVGCYWDFDRHHVEEGYCTIEMPFEPIQLADMFEMTVSWSMQDFLGYLNSWSAVQNYRDQNGGTNPVDELADQLKTVWRNNLLLTGRFPLFVRLGKIIK